MNTIGQSESLTQQEVIEFFENVLGYAYLGNRKHRLGNRNFEDENLAAWLRRQRHGKKIIEKVLLEVHKAATTSGSKSLYGANQEVYGLLRYGVKVQPQVGEQHKTVWLIDWKNPVKNHFGIAEEVTVVGENTKRPDIVLYVNGIALGVLELKRSTVSVSEGIRQNLDNQQREFILPFFSTVQLIMAGNTTEGLRYGVIETPEKHWLRCKSANETNIPLSVTDNLLARARIASSEFRPMAASNVMKSRGHYRLMMTSSVKSMHNQVSISR